MIITKKKTAEKQRAKRTAVKKRAKPGINPSKNASYNQRKEFDGKQYTGMSVGRSHTWHYDPGVWKETKITPDLWRISFSVTKRRAGKAPRGSGAAVGTAYHWYILAHQRVQKLNANDYSTGLTGLKYKLAHKRAGKDWNVKTPTQRSHLIKFLKQWLHELEEEVIILEFEHKKVMYKGEAIPLPDTCADNFCTQFDITLNNEHTGIIRLLKSGWKMEGVDDNPFVKAIGSALMLHYKK
jgi:hypothetical protein